MKARSREFLDRAIAAMVAAIDGKHKDLSNYYRTQRDLAELCEATEQLYLDLPGRDDQFLEKLSKGQKPVIADVKWEELK